MAKSSPGAFSQPISLRLVILLAILVILSLALAVVFIVARPSAKPGGTVTIRSNSNQAAAQYEQQKMQTEQLKEIFRSQRVRSRYTSDQEWLLLFGEGPDGAEINTSQLNLFRYQNGKWVQRGSWTTSRVPEAVIYPELFEVSPSGAYAAVMMLGGGRDCYTVEDCRTLKRLEALEKPQEGIWIMNGPEFKRILTGDEYGLKTYESFFWTADNTFFFEALDATGKSYQSFVYDPVTERRQSSEPLSPFTE